MSKKTGESELTAMESKNCKTFRNSVYLLKKLYILNALGIVGARSVGKQLAASNEAERRNPEKPDLP